jgi:hypothetical protein
MRTRVFVMLRKGDELSALRASVLTFYSVDHIISAPPQPVRSLAIRLGSA